VPDAGADAGAVVVFAVDVPVRVATDAGGARERPVGGGGVASLVGPGPLEMESQ
jgi:hypothetical protein